MKTQAPIVIQAGEQSKNAVGRDIGKGMFISDVARGSLKMAISEDEFAALKAHVNQESIEDQKCFITNKWCKPSEGVFIPSTLMADALEKNIDAADKVWTEFSKEKRVTCSSCGKKFGYDSKEVLCPYCNEITNTKKYGKRIKLPSSKKLAFKLYIKYLRGKTK